MRQAGMLAAAGLYALEHHVQRLAEDHWNARLLADGLAQFPEIRLAFEKTDTNIVIFDIVADSVDAKTFATRLKQHDIAIGVEGPRRLRAVTHLNVDEAGIVRTLDAMRGILSA
jgi:threonine aldolase